MWTASTSLMFARLASSTLYANHNVASILAFEQRSVSTTTTENSNLISKMRDLRARGPYALFMKDNYNGISAQNPNLKLADVSKKVAEAWKSLSDDKKQTYIKKFENQRTHYEEEKKRLSPTDLQTIDADEKAKRIENRVKKSMQQLPTKRPRSAYAHFLSSLDRGDADIGSFVKGAAQRWTHMAVQEKQKFEDLHQEERQKYVKALLTWAAANDQRTKPARRSKSASTATQTEDTPVKKTRAKSTTGKRTMRKRTTSAASPTKSTKTKSTQTTSDKEDASSSSSDDESTPKTKKP